MRPPYFSTNALVLQTLGEMDFHVVNANIDTKDYANDSEDGIETSLQIFRDGLAAGGSLVLAHDVHRWTAEKLVSGMIEEVQSRGLRGMCFD